MKRTISERQAARKERHTATTSAFLTVLPAEIRNMIYGYCFLSLPSSPMPLDEAHFYRPATNLLLVNRQLWNETSGFVHPIAQAWRSATWTIDLDALAAVHAAPDDLLLDLSEEDAEMVRSVRFTTTRFPLAVPEADEDDEDDEEEEAKQREGSVFREPFSFTISLWPPANKASANNDNGDTTDIAFLFSCPPLSATNNTPNPTQRLDDRYLFVLSSLKIYLYHLLTVTPSSRMRACWQAVLFGAAVSLREVDWLSGGKAVGISWRRARHVCAEGGLWDVIRLNEDQGRVDEAGWRETLLEVEEEWSS